MTFSLLFFIVLAIALIGVLAWALRPSWKTLITPEDVLGALSEERHYARLPQILQSLRKDDTEYMRERGHEALWNRVRQERKRIAIRYLDDLEQEFQMLLEASRILARLAPQLSTTGEFDRLRKNVRFIFYCRYLRWQLRLGREPWNVFNHVSDMAGAMTLQLETAMTRLGESVASGGERSLPPNLGSGRAL